MRIRTAPPEMVGRTIIRSAVCETSGAKLAPVKVDPIR
jgi:hypothetical protein